ncbi:PAS domain-containing protein, partial [Salmonella sp. s50237]|uniref:PAS domain-containing protein n=1 Tax=Salmonella sp. s50237 TaxID=3159649 RepID=UPI00397F29BD
TALPDAVLVTDADGRVTQANHQAAVMGGLDGSTAILGRPLTAVLAALTPVEAPSWDLLLQRVASQPGRGIADDEMPQPSPVTTEASGPHGRQYL